MKIIVTGARGNLGSAILRSCTHRTVSIGRDEWTELDRHLAAGADAVIHAAYDLQGSLSEHPSAILHANAGTTFELLERMRQRGTPRLVFISSCAVYGESMNTSEDSPRNPLTVNGIVKLLNERVIEQFCERNGIRFEIYRLFNLYGGDDRFSIISMLQQSLRSGTPFRLNNGGVSQRDFVHVNDVAAVITGLLDRDHGYRHVNIGTGVATRIADLVDLARRKHPSLRIEEHRVAEAEYSRADITRLRSLMDRSFIDVRRFVEEEL
jgi:UDP-glucose 4-epimerase